MGPMERISNERTVNSRGDRDTVRPARAALYSGTPFTLTAEYIGGAGGRRPTKTYPCAAQAALPRRAFATPHPTCPTLPRRRLATATLNTARSALTGLLI